jgi:cytochrome c-type protein NapC
MAEHLNDKPRSRSRTWLVLILTFAAGILFSGMLNIGLSSTNELEFCTSCHSMLINFEEYQKTVHYKSASGVRATCADCHVPKEFGPKMVAKILAYKDVVHEILGTIDTPEKFEARRWEMANRVWAKMQASNSRECRSCHDFAQMDLSAQDRSARKRHARADDEGKTCIECHKGIAHMEPDDPNEKEDTDEAGENQHADEEQGPDDK